ncbi:MAG: AAA family ATPase [Acidobacteriia bacterium]|nr:AAA family ATPase [Terriglobia bacterium]
MIPNLRGAALLPADLEKLAKCGISAELATAALLRRVDSRDGAEMIGRNGNADCSGILFPYTWPGEDHVRDYRLRRDRPDLDPKADGSFKERDKYLSAPGRGNMLYFHPGTDARWLDDASVPILITEGEKKALALWGLSWHGVSKAAEHPRWLSIGLSGVWNWRGTVGKAPGPDGSRRDVKGVIPDVNRITWKGRKVTIVFDKNALNNNSVQAARHSLTSELRKRGAEVFWFTWPIDTPAGVNGVDDLVGVWGEEKVFDSLLKGARPFKPVDAARKAPLVVLPAPESMENILENDSICAPELMVDGFLPKNSLVLLGGRPKDGKSWLACQLALAMVTGEPLAGWLNVREPGRVHLWALEDQKVLTKDKMQKILAGRRPDGLRNLQVFDELSQPILQGGDAIINGVLKQHPADLIILDSLFKLTGGSAQRNSDISQKDYDVIDRVRKIAIENNCAAVIVMHTKKGARGGNPIENIIGTSGTSAAADAVAELKRTSAREGKLTIVGRMVQQEDYELAWHCGQPENGTEQWGWTIESAGDDASMGETMLEVRAYLEAQGACKPASIASALHKSFGSVWQALLRLQDRGKAVRGKDKKWELRRAA